MLNSLSVMGTVEDIATNSWFVTVAYSVRRHVFGVVYCVFGQFAILGLHSSEAWA